MKQLKQKIPLTNLSRHGKSKDHIAHSYGAWHYTTANSVDKTQDDKGIHEKSDNYHCYCYQL